MDAFTETDRPLRFGSFELDVRSRELRTGSRSIRLQEQPFEILRMMLERPGHVVTRNELRDRLWPDGTFVDYEHSLNAAITRLRAALGDDADNPRFVETLPRRGYRFIGASAYQEYLKGRYHWNKLDDERESGSASALQQALSSFARALTIDPDFAAAHAITARVHIARAQQYLEVPRHALEKARTFATRAVGMEPFRHACRAVAASRSHPRSRESLGARPALPCRGHQRRARA